MRNNRVHIEELRLRVPNMSRADAERLGKQVAEQLAQALPQSAGSKRIGSLNVRMPQQGRSSHAELAVSIAKAVATKVE